MGRKRGEREEGGGRAEGEGLREERERGREEMCEYKAR